MTLTDNVDASSSLIGFRNGKEKDLVADVDGRMEVEDNELALLCRLMCAISQVRRPREVSPIRQGSSTHSAVTLVRDLSHPSDLVGVLRVGLVHSRHRLSHTTSLPVRGGALFPGPTIASPTFYQLITERMGSESELANSTDTTS